MAIQYKVVKAPQSFESVEPFLNQHGADNWQLVWYTEGTLAIFSKTGGPAETGVKDAT